ncbi:MAG TPA: DNA polymerase III subunit gamma/tau [Rhodopila sp.]|jgi:DNA polymerase-3 subunit gamma/tau|nr:DNA polymerase III subunit gamma/tau [Rhodopila sp.]
MSGLFQDDPVEPDSNESDDTPPPPEGPGLFGDALPVALPGTLPEPVHATPYRVLARKYRPTTFDDLIGQEAMVRTLRNAFAVGRVAHAFMLTGVRGVGKTTTARIIARALNCIGPDGTGGPTADPCGVCSNCVGILADRHPDVIEMDAASRTGVDDMREVIEATRFRPMQARTKVFVIDEVHMLSRNAFNALLKTLEEPPPHVKFVFATTEIRKVPITVLSRCQRFDLRRVRIAELVGLFGRIAEKENVTIEPAALEQIARSADGSVRDGLSMLDQAIAQAEGTITNAQVVDMLGLADREAVFELMDAVMGGKAAAALAITDRAYERGADLGTLLQDLLDLLHTVTRLKSVPVLRESQDLPEAERTRGAELADRLSVPVLARAWQMLLKGVGEVEIAPDRRAAAEMVLIRLCHVSEMPTPGDLIRRLTSGAPAGGPAPSAPGGGTPGGGAPGGGAPGGGGGGVRAVANGAPMISAEPAHQAGPRLGTFRDVVALVGEQKQAMLHAHLLHSVHLVRFAPPVIELRPQAEAPKDLSSKLAALLSELTGTRWTIAVSREAGEPTIAEQGNAADTARKSAAADHPLVQAILAAFPGARIDTVHDKTVDAYGLPAAIPDMPEFAPPDAAYFDDDPMEIDL